MQPFHKLRLAGVVTTPHKLPLTPVAVPHAHQDELEFTPVVHLYRIHECPHPLVPCLGRLHLLPPANSGIEHFIKIVGTTFHARLYEFVLDLR
jgi:hypothetical protein